MENIWFLLSLLTDHFKKRYIKDGLHCKKKCYTNSKNLPIAKFMISSTASSTIKLFCSKICVPTYLFYMYEQNMKSDSSQILLDKIVKYFKVFF